MFNPLNTVNRLFDPFSPRPLRLAFLSLAITIITGSSTTVWASHLTLKKPPPAIERLHQTPKEPSSKKVRPRPSATPEAPTPLPSPVIKATKISTPEPSSVDITSLQKQIGAQGKPHTRVGWNYLLNGNPRAAIAVYREAIRTNPNSAKAYLGLGITLKTLGNTETAKRALIQAANLNPRLPSALVHLGYLYADGHLGQPDAKRARQLFYQAAQLGDPFAKIALLDLKSRPRS